jgi:uncharacterized protein
MHPTLELNRPAISNLCEMYGVIKLEVFGSATRSDFDPLTSDFDFVIDISAEEPRVGRRFLIFAEELEALLGRRVDLVFEERMKPRFREAVNETREVVFERRDGPVAA